MKIIIRILLSPFIFMWGVFLLAALTFFPLSLIVPLSILGFIGTPFVWLLKQGGTDIAYPESLVGKGGSMSAVMGEHLLVSTIHLWGAFYVTYLYLKTGEVYFPE